MSGFTRSLYLPMALFLSLTAEDCEKADRVEEHIAVRTDGSVEVGFQHKARNIDRVLDSDPPPSLEAGWDSVHVGLMRENDVDKYYLRAWTSFPPGADLPGSYAEAGDPLLEWYVRFPSELEREVRGDTVLFHYRRTYPALPWSPMEHFEDLTEEIDSAEAVLEALKDREGGSFEAKWEESGVLEKAEEEGDSVTLRQHQREFRGLVQVGDPSVFEVSHRVLRGWVQYSALSDLAFAIPAGASFCGEIHSDPTGAVTDLVKGILTEVEIPPELTWAALLEEANVEPDPTVFPELSGEDFDLWFEDFLEELGIQTIAKMREALQRECGLSPGDGVEFDRRSQWFSERYRISDGMIQDQRFHICLFMPGDLVETNADSVVDGRPEWDFSIRDLFEGDLTLTTTTRLVVRDR